MVTRISQHSPSFSSTLLDSIYRSIDQGEDEMATYTEALRKNKPNTGAGGVLKTEEEMANFRRRACMIDKWMEKKAVVRRKSAADPQTKKPRKLDRLDYSSWSSSDSSGGGLFSSAEAESFPLPRPKLVRTGGSGLEKVRLEQNHHEPELDRRGRRGSASELDPKPKDEGGFLKTKSRALKIYGDLKKVKQPISPGAKLAGFLNSLFAGAGKPKMAARGVDYSPSLNASRSCLSKTPSSGGKSSGRSVRFCPVSVIVDEEYCQPRGHQNNTKKQANSIGNVINEELMVHVMEKNQRNLLRNYQMKPELELSFDNLKKSHVKSQSTNQGFDYEEEEDDDEAASCASSDLFELDNLSAIGMDQRYRQELPVYETTQLDHTNRALANGMMIF